MIYFSGLWIIVLCLHFIYDVTLLHPLVVPYFSLGLDVGLCNGSW